MSLITTIYSLAADVPPAGSTALPGGADAKFGTVFGWGLGIVGIVAVLALFAAGISWMVAKNNQTSTDGPEKAVKVIGGVILAVSAASIVNLMLA